MNRKEEYWAIIEELSQPSPELETTLERAYLKRRKNRVKRVFRHAAGFAACFAIFVFLVNYCAPIAYACSYIPVLRELAEAVTFSQSLTDAVENEYVQMIDLSQTKNDITAEVAYLIVDQKQVNVFYRLYSEKYEKLAADPDIQCEDQALQFAVAGKNFSNENGELLTLSIDFTSGDVPDKLHIILRVYSNGTNYMKAPVPQEEAAIFSDNVANDPGYLVDFDFSLEFDPQFTSSGKIIPVNQTVILENQAITVTDIEVYPTHMRVEIEESLENTSWLKDLDFYIETDLGMKFDPVSSGITAIGSPDSPSMVSYRADSTYFYEAEHLKLVITGAKWLRKDMETTYLNLVTGEHGALPEGGAFDSARKQGSDWIVTFRVNLISGKPMHALFGHTFYDADGNTYGINHWGSTLGEADEKGNITYFYDKFPLKNFPYEEVWLSPLYSHYWTAENPVVITIC